MSHLHEICIYIWVVYSLCFFCCLFITVTWWYVWCIEWASGNQEEVQACLVTLWLFIISCYSLYKTTLGLGVGGAVRFLVVGTIGQEERPPRGSALDGAVFDIAQILAYLVHNMSRSQLYLGFGHFGWLLSFLVNYILAGLWLNCISSVEITLFRLADISLQHRALFQC